MKAPLESTAEQHPSFSRKDPYRNRIVLVVKVQQARIVHILHGEAIQKRLGDKDISIALDGRLTKM